MVQKIHVLVQKEMNIKWSIYHCNRESKKWSQLYIKSCSYSKETNEYQIEYIYHCNRVIKK